MIECAPVIMCPPVIVSRTPSCWTFFQKTASADDSARHLGRPTPPLTCGAPRQPPSVPAPPARRQVQRVVKRRPAERHHWSVERADAAPVPRAESAARPGWALASTPGVIGAARRADLDRYPRRRL